MSIPPRKLDYERPRRSPFLRWTFVVEKWGCIIMGLILAFFLSFIAVRMIHLRGLGSSWGE
jgi:hypothetical protein